MADELPGGYKIEAGQDVMISVYNIHHSPQVWDNAEEFVPERFDVDGPVPNETNTDFKYAILMLLVPMPSCFVCLFICYGNLMKGALLKPTAQMS